MPRDQAVPTVHCLRISMTATAALKRLVVDNEIRQELRGRCNLAMRVQQVSMPDALQRPNAQVAFFLHEPLARFVAGFISRAGSAPGRQPQPAAEASKPLDPFSTPTDLAEALTSPDQRTKDRALVTMAEQMPTRLTSWLVDVDYLERMLRRIAFIGFVDRFAEDVQRFFKVLGVQRKLDIPPIHDDAHVGARAALSGLAERNLRTWYADDLEIFQWATSQRARWRPASGAAATIKPSGTTVAASPAATGASEQLVDPARRQAAIARDEHSGGFNFLLAGVQKAGTSTLFALIKSHPQVAKPRSKELHFFSNDRLNWSRPDYARYDRNIKWTGSAKIAGEATPRYLFWPQAMKRIKAYNPQMLLIVSFRDPIERAFSHWSMLKGDDPAQQDFGAVVQDHWAGRHNRPRDDSHAGAQDRTIVGRGLYGEQLEHALTLFGRDQFLLLDYHRVFQDLPSALDRILTFLGLDPFPDAPADRRVRAAPRQLVAAAPTADDIASLVTLYAPDLEHFANLSGIDISAWPTSRMAAGTLDPGEFAQTLTDRAQLIAPDSDSRASPANATRRGERGQQA